MESDKVELIISDNGVGGDIREMKRGVGFKLLDALVVFQLKGDVKFINQDGLSVIMKFKA